jgi:hypothetical protein
MSQVPTFLDPWKLVWGQPFIDSQTLAAAIEQDLERNSRPDFRTRLLVRDSAVALQSYWGHQRFALWLAASPVGRQIHLILEEELGEPGFVTIEKRLVDRIDPRLIRQVFDLLGRGIHERVEVNITGSIVTMIKGLTARPTSSIEIAEKVPYAIYHQGSVLRQIQAQFGLVIVKSLRSALSARWQDRQEWLGDFGGRRVHLVDVYDVFVSTLPSDYDMRKLDLRVLAYKLDRDKARHRLLTDGQAFLDDPKLKPQIEENWRFIFQEPLFAEKAAKLVDKRGRPPHPAQMPLRDRNTRNLSISADAQSRWRAKRNMSGIDRAGWKKSGTKWQLFRGFCATFVVPRHD